MSEKRKEGAKINTNIKYFNKKQLNLLTWWSKNSPQRKKAGIICDGAIRSGKTVCMSLSFVLWAFCYFGNKNFALCGNTIISLRRNFVEDLKDTLKALGFLVVDKKSENYLEITKNNVSNRFYLFGGGYENSSSRIQGMTLAGVLFDEVALMTESFVEQALARCSINGAKFWFNCNPEHPYHWFYREWIKKADEKNLIYLHFKIDDNPGLSEKTIERYHSLYEGNFYEKYIEGRWVAAEGLVYCFNEENNLIEEGEVKNLSFTKFFVSCDYGTVNPFSAGLWGKSEIGWVRIKEYYFSSKKENATQTDEEYYDKIKALIGDIKVEAIIVDPSAASFIETIKRHGEFKVVKAKNDVKKGINAVNEALKAKKIYISSACQDALREFNLYVWSEKNLDSPQKENDHAMDDIRYFVNTVLREFEVDNFCFTLER